MPELELVVASPAGQSAAIRCVVHGEGEILVAAQPGSRLVKGRVPEVDGQTQVPSARCQLLAIGRERQPGGGIGSSAAAEREKRRYRPGHHGCLGETGNGSAASGE